LKGKLISGTESVPLTKTRCPTPGEGFKWGRGEGISYVAQRKDGAPVDLSATRQTLANAEIDGKQHNVLSGP